MEKPDERIPIIGSTGLKPVGARETGRTLSLAINHGTTGVKPAGACMETVAKP